MASASLVGDDSDIVANEDDGGSNAGELGVDSGGGERVEGGRELRSGMGLI